MLIEYASTYILQCDPNMNFWCVMNNTFVIFLCFNFKENHVKEKTQN